MAVSQAELGDVRDVARLLKISTRGVYRLVDLGQIPVLRVGHQLRFDLAEVLEAVREQAS
jgi:excisionase family DNA binding protein